MRHVAAIRSARGHVLYILGAPQKNRFLSILFQTFPFLPSLFPCVVDSWLFVHKRRAAFYYCCSLHPFQLCSFFFLSSFISSSFEFLLLGALSSGVFFLTSLVSENEKRRNPREARNEAARFQRKKIYGRQTTK